MKVETRQIWAAENKYASGKDEITGYFMTKRQKNSVNKLVYIQRRNIDAVKKSLHAGLSAFNRVTIAEEV